MRSSTHLPGLAAHFLPFECSVRVVRQLALLPQPVNAFPSRCCSIHTCFVCCCVYSGSPPDMHGYPSNMWRTCHNDAKQLHAEYVVVMIAVTLARRESHFLISPFSSSFLSFFRVSSPSFAACRSRRIRVASLYNLALDVPLDDGARDDCGAKCKRARAGIWSCLRRGCTSGESRGNGYGGTAQGGVGSRGCWRARERK